MSKGILKFGLVLVVINYIITIVIVFFGIWFGGSLLISQFTKNSNSDWSGIALVLFGIAYCVCYYMLLKINPKLKKAFAFLDKIEDQ